MFLVCSVSINKQREKLAYRPADFCAGFDLRIGVYFCSINFPLVTERLADIDRARPDVEQMLAPYCCNLRQTVGIKNTFQCEQIFAAV
ncbi:hypothetical protein M514_03702 [Trichuris suis]|uniref:Uncharacterized protein n=1 Tax=Trichuris suis TaxID=68888 RepID=A0A085MDR6_9BILA|nr:hypothetical protein M513_03702 [Trichuris suis]KFD68685.1 hypothetical protein M514_03702 [Trichuris suis]